MLGPRAEFAVLKGKSAVPREISPNSPSVSLPSGPEIPQEPCSAVALPSLVRWQLGPGPATSPPASLPAAASGAEGSPVGFSRPAPHQPPQRLLGPAAIEGGPRLGPGRGGPLQGQTPSLARGRPGWARDPSALRCPTGKQTAISAGPPS